MEKKEDITPKDENGKKHGLHIIYWSNGNIMYKEEWYHGKYNGIRERYYYNGNLHFKCNFKMHRLYGLHTTYKYENNKISYKKFYL